MAWPDEMGSAAATPVRRRRLRGHPRHPLRDPLRYSTPTNRTFILTPNPQVEPGAFRDLHAFLQGPAARGGGRLEVLSLAVMAEGATADEFASATFAVVAPAAPAAAAAGGRLAAHGEAGQQGTGEAGLGELGESVSGTSEPKGRDMAGCRPPRWCRALSSGIGTTEILHGEVRLKERCGCHGATAEQGDLTHQSPKCRLSLGLLTVLSCLQERRHHGRRGYLRGEQGPMLGHGRSGARGARWCTPGGPSHSCRRSTRRGESALRSSTTCRWGRGAGRVGHGLGLT